MTLRRQYARALPGVALLAIWPVSPALAQDAAAAKAALQAKVEDLKQSLGANKKALQAYSWTETTQISLKGEVKKTEIKQCRYASDGTVIKTDAPGSAPAPAKQSSGGGGRKGGRVKEKVIENKVDEMKDYMQKSVALIKTYVPPDPGKIQASVAAGKAALDKDSTPDVAQLTFSDYNLPGDKLAIALNTSTKQLARVNVDSYLDKEKDAVTLAVRFAALPDGTNYDGETVLVAKAKQIQVKITNSGYTK